MQLFKTDLAVERRRADIETPGVSYEKKKEGGIETEILTVTSAAGARELGKPCGVYTTYSFPALSEWTEDIREALCDKIGTCLKESLERVTQRRIDALSILVIGLGNRHITADAIGCKTAEQIHATAHIQAGLPALFSSLEAASIAILLPGVLADSGMEACDLAAACAKTAKADAVIAFDALFARSFERIGKTVQISDSGIEPGGGIGNRRKALSRETLGIPVLSVGVPTVTDTGALLSELLASFSEEDKARICAHVPPPFTSFLSTSDCDQIAAELSSLLANAVNRHIGILL